MTTSSLELTCNADGCPFPDQDRCLEGFTDFDECPNTVEADGGEAEDTETHTPASDATDFGSDSVADLPRTASQPMVDLGGQVAFDVDDVEEFLQRESGRVVLIAGPIESGKTTLVVELYAQFLAGPFGGAKFGGSETLRALGTRHFPALERSGGAEPTTHRTADEDMRLLHLHLDVDGASHHLLFTDVRGEFFENIIDGESAARDISIAQRVDKCIVVVDGARVANARLRDTALTAARQLVGGLRSDGGVPPETPIAVLCAKWDKVAGESQEEKVGAEVQLIADFAANEHHSPVLFKTAVRSGSSEPDLTGLTEVLQWLTAIDSPSEAVDTPLPRELGGRQFWKEPGA